MPPLPNRPNYGEGKRQKNQKKLYLEEEGRWNCTIQKKTTHLHHLSKARLTLSTAVFPVENPKHIDSETKKLTSFSVLFNNRCYSSKENAQKLSGGGGGGGANR